MYSGVRLWQLIAMCIVLFAWQHHDRYPLVVAANRDEFYHRPAEPARWRGDILCGLDLSAGGTWLGVTRDGRFAVVTNFREPLQDSSHGVLSRGALPMGFLEGTQSPEAYCRSIAGEQEQYGPFNLLVSDGASLWYVSNRGAEPQAVAPGIHGLSNGLLDTPWPKVERGKQKLEKALGENGHHEPLLELLQDDWTPDDHWLPETGVGIEMERLVAPIFIHSAQYGTRASTVVHLREDGPAKFFEQRWSHGGQPDGQTQESRGSSE